MAWVEKTFHDVPDPDSPNKPEDERIREVLRDYLPPYIKLSSRRARKALERYEKYKRKHIEALAENVVYKFVMQVAAFTNEPIETFWKGKALAPFMESHDWEDRLTMSSNDLDGITAEAEQRALSDLNMYCGLLQALPMFTVDHAANAPVGSDPSVGPRGSSGSGGPSGSKSDRGLDISASTTALGFSAPHVFMPSGGYAPKRSGLLRNNEPLLMSDPDFRTFLKALDTHPSKYPESFYQVTRNYTFLPQVSVMKWESPRAALYFQRFIGRILACKDTDQDIPKFKSKYKRVFNNVYEKDGEMVRDLTGLRLTYNKYEDDEEDDAEESNTEGNGNRKRKRTISKEVPYGFAKPLYEERLNHWQHEIIFGKFERESQYQADAFLQKTPWAIGKIYLMPSIYGHMQESHFALRRQFKQFENVSVEDFMHSADHRFLFAKLVALCIRSSTVLSDKRYGLDKTYMRLNLEKRRIMHVWKKTKAPKRKSHGVMRFVSMAPVKSPSGKFDA